MVQTPAVEGGQGVWWQVVPAIHCGVNSSIGQAAAKSLVGIAVQLARGFLAPGQHAARAAIAKAVRCAGIDAVAPLRVERRTSLTATVGAQLSLQADGGPGRSLLSRQHSTSVY